MKIKNLLCAATAISALTFGGNNADASIYTLNPVSEKTNTSITLYEINKETNVVTPKYNEVSLNKTFFANGTASSDGSINYTVILPNGTTQTITARYDSLLTRNHYEGYTDENIFGYFVNVRNNGSGGAIYNTVRGGRLSTDFLGNVSTFSGGAIYNNNGSFVEIWGDFIANYANQQGGAIYNYGTNASIGNINGNFINNQGYSGGAIENNQSQIANITGSFVNNTATSLAGAINNTQGGKIGNITGDFIGNKALGGVGGAIYNYFGSQIGDITGDFIGNTAKSYGGAIYSLGIGNKNTTIGNIVGNFIENKVTSTSSAAGGAIYLSGNNSLGLISGDFFGNSATAEGDYSTAQGGAIYNGYGIETTLSGNFIGNFVTADSDNLAQGGAIYNEGTVNIVAKDKNIIFEGNTANGNSEAIYNYWDAVVNFTTENGNKIYMNDAINGYTGIINISGDMILNNTIKGNTINLNNGSLKLGEKATFDSTTSLNLAANATLDVLDGAIKEYTLNSLTSNNGNLRLDIDASNLIADKFIVSGNSYGKINISNFNIINPAEILGEIQIVTGNNSIYFNNTELYTSDGKFYISNVGNGKIQIDSLDREKETFQNMIKYKEGHREFSITADDTVTRDLENMSGTSMNVYGNGHTIDGNGYEGFSVAEKQKLSIENVVVKNFQTTNSGGFINNYGTITNISGTFENNIADSEAGVICNVGIINSINGEFRNNKANVVGAILNNGGTIKELSGIFENNTSETIAGAIGNTGLINIVAKETNTIFTGNKDISGSNAIINSMGTINLNTNTDMNIIFNDAIGITVEEYVNALAGNLSDNEKEEMIENLKNTFLNRETNVVNINGNEEQVKPTIKKMLLALDNKTEEDYNTMDSEAKLAFDKKVEEYIQNANIPTYTSGTVEINNNVKNQTVNMFDGTLKLGTNIQNDVKYTGSFNKDVIFNYFGGQITLQDGSINHANLGNMTLHNEMKLSLNADLANETIDTISANSFNSNGNSININNINLLSGAKKSLSLSPLSQEMDSAVREEMAKSIIYTGGDVAFGNIYKYTVAYDPTNANLNFGLKSNGSSLNDFAPSVAVKPIAQSGAQSVQMDSYTEAFKNMDMFMLMPENERLAHKYKNKYASLTDELVYDPTMSTYQNNTAWFRPYTTFENVPLKNGPKVSNVSYGSYFGYDTSLTELGKGWDGTFGVYAGYNGSHQAFKGNSIYQNGGTLGLIGVAYKGKFFTGLTINVGASAGSTSTAQGSDNFTSLMGGISTKNGYNFEFADGKFIVQPSVLLSYSLVNTFDYTSASGAKMKSDPLHTLQIEPSIKLIGNIGTWQPYANVAMVWNVLNETEVTANNVKLPEVSVKPYVKYGVGLQKKWADKFTAFGQAYVTNGGRNGVGLQAGLRIALGDETRKPKAAWLTPKKKDTVIVINGKTK